MGLVPTPACPTCGFAYAWDGTRCGHCRGARPSPTPGCPSPAEPGGSQRLGRASAVRELAVLLGFLSLVLLACLILLGRVSRGAEWLGVRDCTTAYLAGSVVAGLAGVAQAAVLLRNRGRWTRSADWLCGAAVIWIPVSLGVLVGALPGSVPRWLPAGYLGFFLLWVGYAVLRHRSSFTATLRAAWSDRSVPPEQYPVASRWETLLDGAFGALFAGAGGLLLVW